jgi:FMN phosphatase YigB (HAD superfamily)
MTKELQAVFIDWNGTLSTSKFWGHLEEQNPEVFSIIQTTLFQGNMSPYLDPWMRGVHDSEAVIAQLAKATGLTERMLYYEFIHAAKTMQLVSHDVLDQVAKLRQQGIKVVIATDNMDSFNRWTAPILQLNEHFDAILNSHSLRARKKDFDLAGDSKFFGRYLRQMNIDPRQTVIIDDTEDKGGVLLQYGMDYRKIEFGIGLVPELERILHDTQST